MLKKRKDEDDLNKLIIRWATILHDDLSLLHQDNLNKSKTKREKELYESLRGLRDSITYDACSGIGYIYEGKFYTDLTEIGKDVEDLDAEIPVQRVISVDYLLHFLGQMLEK